VVSLHNWAMILRNFTPHDPLTYIRENGTRQVLPQEGVARCSEEPVADGYFDQDHEYPRTLITYGLVSGLPDAADDAIVVVSQLVVQALPQRSDLAYPAGLLRDGKGTIVGFSQLARPAK